MQDNPVLEARSRLRLSRYELARKSGCSANTIQNIEKGATRSISPEIGGKLAAALGDADIVEKHAAWVKAQEVQGDG